MENSVEGKSFLVTGGAGFIGSNIVEYLLENGARLVRVIDNLSNGYRENISHHTSHPNFEFLEGDICDFDMCVRAVDKVEYVSHQAALGSVPRSIIDPLASAMTNVLGFLNMLVAVKDSPSVKRMVYASSSSVYGDSAQTPKREDNLGKLLSPYAATKYTDEVFAEIFSKTYGLHTIGFRYFNVFGPRQNPLNPYAAVIPIFFTAALTNQPPTIFGDGNTSRDFTFVANAVQANVKALLDTQSLRSHEVVNVAVGQTTTLTELWNKIADICGSSMEPQYQSERPGDVRQSLADINKAQNLFGYSPQVDIDAGLKRAYLWYKSNVNELE
jgi:UDP-N-acetylglucosamine 4-epimerase